MIVFIAMILRDSLVKKKSNRFCVPPPISPFHICDIYNETDSIFPLKCSLFFDKSFPSIEIKQIVVQSQSVAWL